MRGAEVILTLLSLLFSHAQQLLSKFRRISKDKMTKSASRSTVLTRATMTTTKASADSKIKAGLMTGLLFRDSSRQSSHRSGKVSKNNALSGRKLLINTSYRSLCSFHMDERGICIDTDCDSEPDRSNPLWKIQPPEEEEPEPESVPSLLEEVKPSLWETIMREYEDKRKEFFNLVELSSPYETPLPVLSKLSIIQYLKKYIFPLLCPILKKTLFKAKELDCLLIQKCRFNGLDYVSQLLWNNNPRYPERRTKVRDIFDIPFAIIWLHFHPRPIYPLSWLWCKEEAIIVMQTYIRRYLVCKEEECSEMRQFWKTMRMENEEEKRERKAKFIEKLEIMFNDILDKLVDDAVYKAEWNIHGCRCKKKPCHCVCKCMKWCKCCTCRQVWHIDFELC